MRALKIVLALLAGVIASGAILLGLALTPRVQTWAVRRWLAARPDLGLSIRSIAIGPGGATIDGLRFERRGWLLTEPSLRVEAPVPAALWGRKMLIRHLSGAGWTLEPSPGGAPGSVAGAARDRRGSRPASGFIPSAQAAEPVEPAEVFSVFEGFFHHLRLPADLRLGSLDLDGDILPLGPAGSRLHLELSGGGLEAGREGSFPVALRFLPPAASGGSNAVSASGTLLAAMDTPRTFSRLEARLDATATGGTLARPVALRIRLTAARSAAADESYTLALSGQDRQLANLKAEYASATHRLAGTWAVDLADPDLKPFVLGRALPIFSAVGDGRFDTDATLSELHASGTLQATGARLGLLRPSLAAVGPLSLSAQFDLAHRAGEVRVDRLELTVKRDQPIAQIRALQAFALNLSSGELKLADPARDLFSVALDGLPVAWLPPLPDGFVLTGGTLRGELDAGARDGGLAVRSRQSLDGAGLSLARDGRVLLDEADVTAGFSGELAPGGWSVTLASASVRRAGALVATISGRAGRLAGGGRPIDATGSLRADLPGLAALGLRPAPGLQGRLAGDFTARLGATRSLQAHLGVSNLVLGPALPAWTLVDAQLRADIDPKGKWTLALPLRFEREGRKSDLTLAGTVSPEAGGAWVEAQLTSTLLEAEDAAALGGGWEMAGRRAGAAPSGGPAGPFWGGVRGRIALACKRLEAPGWTWSDVRAAFQLRPTELEVRALSGSLGTGGDFSASGRIVYAPASAGPYHVSAEVSGADFDLGAFCRARDPSQAPVVDGRFRLTAHMDGVGRDAADIAASLQGEARLASKGGIFRALRANVADSLKRSPALFSEAMDSIGSLFGLRADKAAEAKRAIDKQGQAVAAVAGQLQEIPYDQLSLTIRRGADLDIRGEDFALIAPEIRLSGSGVVTHVAGTPLSDQPFRFQGDLGARGQLAASLGALGLLSGEKDDLGYVRMSEPFRLGGTLGSIDAGPWRDLLVKSALHKAANGLLDKLLGK